MLMVFRKPRRFLPGAGGGFRRTVGVDPFLFRCLSLTIESWLSGWVPWIGMVDAGVSNRRWRRKYGGFRDGTRISRSRSEMVSAAP
jgi:hypothetical protein